MSLRKIDFNKEKNFTCGGKEYRVIEDPGIIRYRMMQKIMLEFGFSATFEDMFKNLGIAVEHYNKHDYFSMSIVLYKMQEAIKNLDEKDDPALRICALFIIEKDEDLTICDEAFLKAKIDCWAQELEASPFFYLAASLIPGWMPAYELIIRGGLSQPKESKSPES